MRDRACTIWFLGQLPPPTSGQTMFNDRIVRGLSLHAHVKILPVGAGVGAKIMRGAINPLRLLFGYRRGDVVYASVPGQAGVWLFLLTVVALRLRGARWYAHHHSFRPIAIGPLRALRWLGRASGGLASHILLCEAMRDGYERLYRAHPDERFICLPNAAFFGAGAGQTVQVRSGAPVVGHLSVMTREKGVPYLLDLWERQILAGEAGVLVLAGPIPDPGLQREVKAAVRRHPDRVQWIGPVTGAAKQAFLARIDMLVLPTQLIDEADPLVLLEAYGAGAVVLAPDRGCIRQRLLSDDWLLTMQPDADAVLLARRLRDAVADRGALPARCVGHAEALRAAAESDAVTFLAEMGLAGDPGLQALNAMRGNQAAGAPGRA